MSIQAPAGIRCDDPTGCTRTHSSPTSAPTRTLRREAKAAGWRVGEPFGPKIGRNRHTLLDYCPEHAATAASRSAPTRYRSAPQRYRVGV